jgi:hypothetical protein
MYSVRRFAVRHARSFELLYTTFERGLRLIEPLVRAIGYERLDAPVAAIERKVKGARFDCQMCGRCALSSTGMACSMNCPKQLRNGPCGGVRGNGQCEVNPAMRCVWVEAEEGSSRMSRAGSINVVQLPVDRSLANSSSWLRELKNYAPSDREAA